MDSTFLGKGMKFPPQINSATGRFSLSEGAVDVKESIYIILMTRMGERFIRPNFGSTLQSYAFMDVNMTNITLMTRDLSAQIQAQEPRISDVDITIDAVTRQGCLLVTIGYTLIESNSTDNMVFPFYLDNATQEEEYQENSYQFDGVYDEPIEEIIN